jgi:hypothetical protein
MTLLARSKDKLFEVGEKPLELSIIEPREVERLALWAGQSNSGWRSAEASVQNLLPCS